MGSERILALGADDEHPFSRLIAIAEQRHELERDEAAAVRQARSIGLTWQMIATALGVSKQAVHKKYGKR